MIIKHSIFPHNDGGISFGFTFRLSPYRIMLEFEFLLWQGWIAFMRNSATWAKSPEDERS